MNMLRNLAFAVAVLLTAGCAEQAAASWITVPSDERLTGEELAALIVGTAVTYDDGSRSEIRGDGGYTFIAADGTAHRDWRWEITADGTVCLESPHGEARCDAIVRSGDGLVLINRRGSRFAIVSVTPL